MELALCSPKIPKSLLVECQPELKATDALRARHVQEPSALRVNQLIQHQSSDAHRQRAAPLIRKEAGTLSTSERAKERLGSSTPRPLGISVKERETDDEGGAVLLQERDLSLCFALAIEADRIGSIFLTESTLRRRATAKDKIRGDVNHPRSRLRAPLT